MKLAPIRTQEAHDGALSRISELISKTDQKSLDEIEVLQMLVERWERERFELDAPSPIDAIRFRMRQANLKPRDLEPFIGSRSRVSEVLNGSRPLSIDMIRALHRHLGIPAASLIAAPAAQDLGRTQEPSKAALQKLRSLGFLKAQEKGSAFISRAFAGTPNLAMLRKTRTDRTNAKTDQAALEAWCGAVMLKSYSEEKPKGSLPTSAKTAARQLAQLSVHDDGPLRAREKLAEWGIQLVILEHLPGTFLDGAAMCRADGTRLIALTLRHNRLDNFWFTLLHELCHVARHLKEGTSIILDDLDVKGSGDVESEADQFAQDALIPPAVWELARDEDLSNEGVIDVANRAGVHASIVAGRWQREFGDYRKFSRMLGRGEVRDLFGER